MSSEPMPIQAGGDQHPAANPAARKGPPRPGAQRPRGVQRYYREVMQLLQESETPFLIGGAYALERYTGIARRTKDIDLFVMPQDCARVLQVLADAGHQTEVLATHWLAKAWSGRKYVDVIFSSGNSLCRVDDAWIEHAEPAEIFGLQVLLVPAEEMIWSKGYIMERDRFDGADIAHLLQARADELDWTRLLQRFGDDWRVLLAHLVLFGFIYPGERHRIPKSVLASLSKRLQEEAGTPGTAGLCRGTLLSVKQYLIDVQRWGWQDARLAPHGDMTPAQIAQANVRLEDV